MKAPAWWPGVRPWAIAGVVLCHFYLLKEAIQAADAATYAAEQATEAANKAAEYARNCPGN